MNIDDVIMTPDVIEDCLFESLDIIEKSTPHDKTEKIGFSDKPRK